MMISRVVSGGQTGVDRAALDAALELGLPCGGWCPKGRLAEDGAIDARYPLKDAPSEDYAQRTEWNIRDSDGTLVLNRGPLAGGTAQTVEIAARLQKPHLMVDLERPLACEIIHAWLRANRIGVLNVAGPRESKAPGISAQAHQFLRALFSGAHPPQTR